MYLTKRQPSASVPALQNIQSTMNRLFDEILDDYFGTGRARSIGWAPPVEIYETDRELVFVAEVPGFEINDIAVSLDNSQLTIAGERKAEEEEGRQYHRNERSYGKFERSFQLPGSFDTEKIKANMKNGILRIALPKREEAKPKRIEVKVE